MFFLLTLIIPISFLQLERSKRDLEILILLLNNPMKKLEMLINELSLFNCHFNNIKSPGLV